MMAAGSARHTAPNIRYARCVKKSSRITGVRATVTEPEAQLVCCNGHVKPGKGAGWCINAEFDGSEPCCGRCPQDARTMGRGWIAPTEVIYTEMPSPDKMLPHWYYIGRDELGDIFRTCCPLLTLAELAAGAEYVCGCDG